MLTFDLKLLFLFFFFLPKLSEIIVSMKMWMKLHRCLFWGNLISTDDPINFLWHEKHPVALWMSSIWRSQFSNPQLSLSDRLLQYVINNRTPHTLWKKRNIYIEYPKLAERGLSFELLHAFAFTVIWICSLSHVAFMRFMLLMLLYVWILN